jgi:hypothetical protein
MTIDLKLNDTKARGRNGTFNAKMVSLSNSGTTKEPKIRMEIWSSRRDGQPPIWADMSIKDAEDIYEGLRILLNKEK